MFYKIFPIALLSLLNQLSVSSDTYRGAVVEYNPVTELSPEFNVQENLKHYVDFMEKAKYKDADIIVFPEGGLFTVQPSPIPDPSDHIVPCDSLTFVTTRVVRELSCASKKYMIYSVVNLLEKRSCLPDDANCPLSGFYNFNTNVVFDRNGMVIARYAKYNLYDEALTNRTEDPELVFFDTDFGVRFGTFTCFDILFSDPAQRLVQQYHIKDFVFPTFWFSELPFLTAVQVQRGWAEANNVNLLASGVNYPSRGSTGSGIFNGKYGEIVKIMSDKIISKLLIADIPKLYKNCASDFCEKETKPFFKLVHDYRNSTEISASGNKKEKAAADSDLNLLKDKLYPYSTEVINHGKDLEKTICMNDFCCDFYTSLESLKPESANYTYRAVVFNGVRGFGMKVTGGVQVCGVVLCAGPHILNCTNRVKNIPGLFKFNAIRIKGNFKLRNSFQIPTTLTDGKELKPLASFKYEFTRKSTESNSEVSLELLWPVNNLHTFAIWGRDFVRDMEPETPIAGTSALMPVPFMFATIFAFVLFVR